MHESRSSRFLMSLHEAENLEHVTDLDMQSSNIRKAIMVYLVMDLFLNYVNLR